VGRLPGEISADMDTIGRCILEDFQRFHERTCRKTQSRDRAGTFLVANAGALICSVIDVVDTGADGYKFIKVDSGMTEVARPTMYGAQHPIAVVRATPETRPNGDYLVAAIVAKRRHAHARTRNPEGLQTRTLTEPRSAIGRGRRYGRRIARPLSPRIIIPFPKPPKCC